jgi:hypothetical protein
MATIALNVPRARKDEAKAIGARWNRFKKTWYVAAGADLSPFKALGFYEVASPAGAPETPDAVTAAAQEGSSIKSTRTIPLTKEQFLTLEMEALYPAGTGGHRILLIDKTHGRFRFDSECNGCTVTPLTESESAAWCSKEMIWDDYCDEPISIARIFEITKEESGDLPDLTLERIEFEPETISA